MAQYIDKSALVAEIKRLLDKYSSVYTFNYGATKDLNHLLSFLDTLEVKEVQEEPVDKCKGCNNVKGCITCVDGDQWAHYKESESEDLEEACKQLAENARKHKAETSSPFFCQTDYKQGVIDGAKWQKEQMMSKAIDASCFGFQGAALFSFRLPADKYLVGSEVKVIVIKED